MVAVPKVIHGAFALPARTQAKSAVRKSQPPIMAASQDGATSPPPFSTEQLEQWKDEVAEWWGAERIRYDHKQTVSLFRQWFRVSKKEAVEMEFNSRDEPERFIEYFLNSIIADFKKKLHDIPIARIESIKLSFQSGAEATVLFQGRKHKHHVPGHAGIVGQVHYQDGTRQTIFQRFVSHPFWQYSHQTRRPG
jgi:hypothetical protein